MPFHDSASALASVADNVRSKLGQGVVVFVQTREESSVNGGSDLRDNSMPGRCDTKEGCGSAGSVDSPCNQLNEPIKRVKLWSELFRLSNGQTRQWLRDKVKCDH